MHLALKAYTELLQTLFVMTMSKTEAVRSNADVIKGVFTFTNIEALFYVLEWFGFGSGNVFYMMEYRDIFLLLLKKFDETKQSRCVKSLFA